MEAAVRILGLKAGDISDSDTLLNLGMDSMQMVEVRADFLPALSCCWFAWLRTKVSLQSGCMTYIELCDWKNQPAIS